MQITLHGKFAQDYGAVHHIEAASIREAVEGLTRQIGFYGDRLVEERPVARIVGYDSEESMEERPDEIHIVPAIYGGKGVGKILVGAALIGLAITNPFGWATLATNAILSIGIGLALNGLAQIFVKSPSLSKSSDPDASKYLGLSNNTTQIGTIRSYSMGRVKLTAPHLLALNVDSTDLVRGEFPA